MVLGRSNTVSLRQVIDYGEPDAESSFLTSRFAPARFRPPFCDVTALVSSEPARRRESVLRVLPRRAILACASDLRLVVIICCIWVDAPCCEKQRVIRHGEVISRHQTKRTCESVPRSSSVATASRSSFAATAVAKLLQPQVQAAHQGDRPRKG